METLFYQRFEVDDKRYVEILLYSGDTRDLIINKVTKRWLINKKEEMVGIRYSKKLDPWMIIRENIEDAKQIAKEWKTNE